MYDQIIEGIAKKDLDDTNAQEQLRFAQNAEKAGYYDLHRRQMQKDGPESARSSTDNGLAEDSTQYATRTSTATEDFVENSNRQALPPAFLRVFPIHVECDKAAAVLGNENTKSIITAKIDGANGDFDAGSSGPLDIFKILMNFHAIHPFVQMKPNVDYRTSQLSEAADLKKSSQDEEDENVDSPLNEKAQKQKKNSIRRRKWYGLGKLSKTTYESVESVARHSPAEGQSDKVPFSQAPVHDRARWLGLSRYLNDDDDHDEQEEWDPVEYANTSTVADIKSVDFKMYWDIPGKVEWRTRSHEKKRSTGQLDINGCKAPEYGMEIVVHGGHVNYGPWADRHRLVLQSIFFPGTFVDAAPTRTRQPGDLRVATLFNLVLRVAEDTVLRIPFREASKDWRWKGRASKLACHKRDQNEPQDKPKGRTRRKSHRNRRREKLASGGEVRPFAWFDIKVEADTIINYDMDMLPGVAGYRNNLAVEVSGLEIFSSLNHALLLRSQRIEMHCDLSYPLAWNGIKEWIFNMELHNLDLFLLRDHTFLLVDLINDWSSGPLPEFFSFSPFRYLLNVKVFDLKMYLNVNDANIVNNSDDLDDNDFVILYVGDLVAALVIPLDRYRPVQNEISFDVEANNLGFELRMPPTNTQSVLLKDKNVAQLRNVTLNGTYNMYSVVTPGMTETMNMSIVGKGFVATFYGFFARQLAKIKENYFGDDLHFKTQEEYQDLVETEFKGYDVHQTSTKSNDLDVILDIAVEDATILLPANVYSCDEYVRLKVDCANVDLRVTNYYLELMVNSNPLELNHGVRYLQNGHVTYENSSAQMFIDGARVFGHRLFGLAPSEPAYVSNWDIETGNIIGECEDAFLSRIVAVVISLVSTIGDEENALPVSHEVIIHDASFIKFKCPLVKLWFHVGTEAFMVYTRDVLGSFNDYVTELFSQRLQMKIPELSVACIDGNTAPRHRSGLCHVAETHAHVSTALSFNMVSRQMNFSEGKDLQQAHIQIHDRRALRAQFLLENRLKATVQDPKADSVSIPLPNLPGPLNELKHRNVDQGHVMRAPARPVTERFETAKTQLTTEESYDAVKKSDAHNSYNSDSLRNEPPSAMHLLRPGHLANLHEASSTNVTFTSSFKAPYFPLENVEPDLSEVPRLPHRNDQSHRNLHSANASLFNEDHNQDVIHQSFIIDTKPGITVYLQPKGITAISTMLQTIMPKTADGILDHFQFETFSRVLETFSRQRGQNSVIDINARVPDLHLRFKSFVPNLEDQSKSQDTDEYNFRGSGLVVSARIKKVLEDGEEEQAVALHTTMNSLSISTRQGGFDRGSEQDAAFNIGIDNILLWLLDGHRTTVHVSYQILEAKIASKKVEYLAALIHRTTMLADDLQAQFADLGTLLTRRRQYLVDQIVRHGRDIADPAFLTRPSYALRAAKNHLRNSDSWKVISRLRFILMSMSVQEKRELISHCLKDDLYCSEDSELHVLSILDQWRSWDAIHVKDSYAMRILYADIAGIANLDKRQNTPTSVVLRSGGLKLVIDPGHQQNELFLDGIILNLDLQPPPPPSAMDLFRDYDGGQTTTVTIHISQASLELNWEMCELIDRVMVLFEQRAPGQQKAQTSTIVASDSELGSNRTIENFHVILACNSASIRIQTLNLIHVMQSEGLNASVTGIIWKGTQAALSINVLSSASSAKMEMKGQKGRLWRLEIMDPSICVAYDKSLEKENNSESLKIAGDSSEILFELQEEIVGIIETIDLVVNGEAEYIYGLAKKHAAALAPDSEVSRKTDPGATIDIDVILFLNAYKISFALVHDLYYVTAGRVVRLAVSPDTRLESSYLIDFDLKSQTHSFISGSLDSTLKNPSMTMPPINGHLKIFRSDAVVEISATTTIEAIAIDGHFVYGLLSTFGTPQILEAIEVIKADVDTVNTTLQRVFPDEGLNTVEKTKSETVRSPIFFDCNITLVSFGITTGAPASNPASPGSFSSELAFTLGTTHVRAANRSPGSDAPLPFPELAVSLGQICLEVNQRTETQKRLYGSAILEVDLTCVVDHRGPKEVKRNFNLNIRGPKVDVYAETAAIVIEIVAHLQDRMQGLDLSAERKYLKRLHRPNFQDQKQDDERKVTSSNSQYFLSSFSFDLRGLQLSYVTRDSVSKRHDQVSEDLIFTLKSVTLLAQSERTATLEIDQMQLQMGQLANSKTVRSANSALLPKVVIDIKQHSTRLGRRFIVSARGDALDVVLNPHFIIPANNLKRSITLSSDKLSAAIKQLQPTSEKSSAMPRNPLAALKVRSLAVRGSFAGAVIRLQGKGSNDAKNEANRTTGGRYGQYVSKQSASATLRAPGIALRILYQDGKVKDAEANDAALNVEFRVDGSNNILDPSVVPLIMQIAHSIKEVVKENPEARTEPVKAQDNFAQKFIEDASIVQADAGALLGRTKLNIGFRICKQEFSLSCQPIAKVAATMKIEDIYIAVHNVDSVDKGHFFAASATFTGLSTRLQHVYSREATFTFDIESVVLSAMNSKHVSGKPGISAILRINPAKTQINAKQLQDVLLFREIWLPPEIRHTSKTASQSSSDEPQDYFVHRYHELAAATAFPWNATVAIAALEVDLDLGQAIGKMSFSIKDLWASSKKNTSSQQTLCIGISDVSIESTGRMSGYVQLHEVKVRTSIAWPFSDGAASRTPLIQGSIGFDRIRTKASFDYQSFAVADITSFEFIMYNVRDPQLRSGDRLVAILDGEKVNVYCTSSAAALGVSLAQAFERLIEEKQASFTQALRDVESFLHREKSILPAEDAVVMKQATKKTVDDKTSKFPISLHTDVVITLRSIDIGAFPRTLLDHQILRVEASDIQARFAVALETNKIHSGLGMTLGQLRVSLATVPHAGVPKVLGDLKIEDVVDNATSARGGIILRVPRVVAAMQTFQGLESNMIDYIFKSSFEGKIDVGWNYSRISFIRGMWETHVRTLASRLGKPLPESKVKISGGMQSLEEQEKERKRDPKAENHQKITAVVDLPQSNKYSYNALEPAIIDTPQLRDMGDATPPLEWIGLHRDRLPHVTHQIVIVTLLEIAKEVEDAYSSILGSA